MSARRENAEKLELEAARMRAVSSREDALRASAAQAEEDKLLLDEMQQHEEAFSQFLLSHNSSSPDGGQAALVDTGSGQTAWGEFEQYGLFPYISSVI